jgi:hypothetical protein
LAWVPFAGGRKRDEFDLGCLAVRVGGRCVR